MATPGLDVRGRLPVMGGTPGDPRPLGGLVDLAGLLGGESDRSRRLLGGLAMGAVVGAAVAGSLLRLAARRRP